MFTALGSDGPTRKWSQFYYVIKRASGLPGFVYVGRMQGEYGRLRDGYRYGLLLLTRGADRRFAFGK